MTYRESIADAVGDDMLTTVADGVGTITFNRPERKNALTRPMFVEFGFVLERWADDPDVRVVVVTGSGDSFCAGADLSRDGGGGPRQHHVDRMRTVHAGAVILHEFPKPVIAKVNGVAVGAGMNLALGADMVVMADTARFSEIFVRRGLSIDWGGSWLLPRLVGLHRAKELAMFGDMVSASEAERIGLVNRVVSESDLDETVAAMAARLAAGPPITLQLIKKQLNRSHTMSMAEALDNESQSQAINFETADTAEAMTAFLEKRDPTFQGH